MWICLLLAEQKQSGLPASDLFSDDRCWFFPFWIKHTYFLGARIVYVEIVNTLQSHNEWNDVRRLLYTRIIIIIINKHADDEERRLYISVRLLRGSCAVHWWSVNNVVVIHIVRYFFSRVYIISNDKFSE